MTPPKVEEENPPVRRYERKPISAKVTGKVEAGLGHLFFDSQDLSLGGAFLKADLLLEVGEELALELRLPNSQVFDAKARVAWVRHTEGAGGMGIEFLVLSDPAKEQLKRYLEGA
jgi:c-di-GMP-binding flagellar brake protein YcgR